LVWDAATGRPLAELRRHAGAVNAVAFSADGKLIATGVTTPPPVSTGGASALPTRISWNGPAHE
jgi:WD40 repeat protein